MLKIGILIYDQAEEMDFAGPWEVFGMASRTAAALGMPAFCQVHLVAEDRNRPVTCAKGLRVLPDISMEDCHALDILVVAGGAGSRREVHNHAMLTWIAKIAEKASWVCSVCTGSQLLCAAGPARGRRITTHWSFVETQRARGNAGEVVTGLRFVQDGKIVTAAGVAAGIDMSLWLLSQLVSQEFSRKVQNGMEYFPAPRTH